MLASACDTYNGSVPAGGSVNQLVGAVPALFVKSKLPPVGVVGADAERLKILNW